MIQVLEGLEADEQVVTSGQFLIDSESRMREALAKMITGNPAAEQKAVVAAAEPAAAPLPATATRPLNDALSAYLKIGDALAGDSTDGVATNADALADAVRRLAPEAPSLDAGALTTAMIDLKSADDLQATRDAFAKLSDAMVPLARTTGIPSTFDGGPVQALHCPMYAGGTRWLQAAGDVRNPYMGSKMLGCFDERDAVPTTPVEAIAP